MDMCLCDCVVAGKGLVDYFSVYYPLFDFYLAGNGSYELVRGGYQERSRRYDPAWLYTRLALI